MIDYEKRALATVDFNDESRNMYGCTPCPKCGSKYRGSYLREGKRTVECDECGLIEPAALVEEES